MTNCIAQLVFMLLISLCLALGLAAFLAVAEFTDMSEGMDCAYDIFKSSEVKLPFQG